MKSIVTGALACALCSPAFAGPLKADVQCRKEGAEPVYDCTIKLADARTAAPVSGAKFTVGADMPSMPMAHNVRPVAAVPSGEPGVYRARLALEMPGTWRLKLQVSSPVRDQLGKTLNFPD